MDRFNFQNIFAGMIKENKKGLFRLSSVVVGIHFISFLLGFAIYIIVIGIQLASWRIFIYWPFARKWLAKTFDLTFPDPDTSKVSPSYTLFVNILHTFTVFLFIALGSYIVKIGINILVQDGFLGQNFIYLFFFDKLNYIFAYDVIRQSDIVNC